MIGKIGLRSGRRAFSRRTGFTLVELLVVILIILLVSVVVLPTVIPAIAHHQVSEAARILQATLAGARDLALNNNAPAGIRLLPDPVFNGIDSTTGKLDPTRILVSNRFVPIQLAPGYSDGLANIIQDTASAGPAFPVGTPPYPQQTGYGYPYPDGVTAGITTPSSPKISVLMVEQSPYTFSTTGGIITPILNPPTSWFWNVRIGDKIRFNSSSLYYTIVGPMTIGPSAGNSELFVNDGLPGTLPLLQRNFSIGGTALPNQLQYLFLVNGLDDNNDGLLDSGWDGLDNNLDGLTDELVPQPPMTFAHTEWEAETWGSSLSTPPAFPTNVQIQNYNGTPLNAGFLNLSYTITRRPIVSPGVRETLLPSNVVVDLTTWNPGAFGTGFVSERSRLPLDPNTGYVDILLNPNGTVVPTTLYSNPSSFGMDSAFYHFWLAERGDLFDPLAQPGTPSGVPYLLPMISGAPHYPDANDTSQRFLKGERRLLTLYTRTGQIITNQLEDSSFNGSNPSLPFLMPQQGVTGDTR